MQYKKRIQGALSVVLVLAVCLVTQYRLQAENADTFISPECVAYCEEIGARSGTFRSDYGVGIFRQSKGAERKLQRPYAD